MNSNKNIKIASELNISQMPNIFRAISRDIKNTDFNEPLSVSKIYGNIYFQKTYDISLYGWSGLQKVYNNLQKIKKLKQHDNIAVINRVVLDPSLCLRILSNQEAKQYWKKDFKYKTTVGKPFSVQFIICDTIDNAKGFYSQADEFVLIEKDNFQIMINTLVHQFVHILDHITAITLQQNCDKLIENCGFSPGNGNGKDDSHLFKTPNDSGKNIDLHDANNPSVQQYSASFAQFVDQLKYSFLEDMQYRHRQFYVEDLSNVLFSCITEYNILKQKNCSRDNILTKLKQLQSKSGKLYYNLFQYIITHNESEIMNYFNNLKRNTNVDYNSIIQDMYQQLKHDSYLGQLNDIQKLILQSV